MSFCQPVWEQTRCTRKDCPVHSGEAKSSHYMRNGPCATGRDLLEQWWERDCLSRTRELATMLIEIKDDLSPKTEGRQTCAACYRTVGTLKSGEVRPYTTSTYVWKQYGEIDERRFHYCASHPRVSA